MAHGMFNWPVYFYGGILGWFILGRQGLKNYLENPNVYKQNEVAPYLPKPGRVVLAAFFTALWLVYSILLTNVYRAHPIFASVVTIALVCLLRVIAIGPYAKYLPEGADTTAEFVPRPLANRPYAGRVAVVTGANRNIGWEISRSLSQLGAHVIMVDMESEEHGEAAANRIRKHDSKASLTCVRLDLSEFAKIGEVAFDIVKIASQLKGLSVPSSWSSNANKNASACIDFLVNNAGMAEIGRNFTRQGYNKCFQVNHLGPYIFTEWLVPYVVTNGPQTSSIVNTASCAHTWWHYYNFSVDRCRSIIRSIEIMNDPTIESYPGNSAYSLSKFCNLVHASQLAKTFAKKTSNNNNVKITSYHPGAVFTDIWRFIPYPFKYVSDFVMALFFKSANGGHQTALHLLTAPHVISGQFYADCSPYRPRDEALDENVWEAVDTWTRNQVKNWLPK